MLSKLLWFVDFYTKMDVNCDDIGSAILLQILDLVFSLCFKIRSLIQGFDAKSPICFLLFPALKTQQL